MRFAFCLAMLVAQLQAGRLIRDVDKSFFALVDHSKGPPALPLAVFQNACTRVSTTYNNRRMQTVAELPGALGGKLVCPALTPEDPPFLTNLTVDDTQVRADAVVVAQLLRTELLDPSRSAVYQKQGRDYVTVSPDAWKAFLEFYQACTEQIDLKASDQSVNSSIDSCRERQRVLESFKKLSSVLLMPYGVSVQVDLIAGKWLSAKHDVCRVSFHVGKPTRDDFDMLGVRADFASDIQVERLLPREVMSQDDVNRYEADGVQVAGPTIRGTYTRPSGQSTGHVLWVLQKAAAANDGNLAIELVPTDPSTPVALTFVLTLGITKPSGAFGKPKYLEGDPARVDNACQQR